MLYKYIKTFSDFVAALIAIVLLSPIILLISIVIKLESKGPVFFTQKRVGKNRDYFFIYKFRSMKVETPNLATDKLGDASKYLTRIGKFIRKTSLDELPQLINILKGEMSFVGPRPALYNQDELITLREEQGIHQVKPGLTGYAQVMGRDNISDRQKVQYDKYYINKISFAFDMKIVLLTFYKVTKTENVRF